MLILLFILIFILCSNTEIGINWQFHLNIMFFVCLFFVGFNQSNKSDISDKSDKRLQGNLVCIKLFNSVLLFSYCSQISPISRNESVYVIKNLKRFSLCSIARGIVWIQFWIHARAHGEILNSKRYQVLNSLVLPLLAHCSQIVLFRVMCVSGHRTRCWYLYHICIQIMILTQMRDRPG